MLVHVLGFITECVLTESEGNNVIARKFYSVCGVKTVNFAIERRPDEPFSMD